LSILNSLVSEAKKKKKRLEDGVRDVFDANTASDQRKRLAQGKPQYYQQQHPDGNIVQRTVSREIDQFNPADGGRTWKQRTPVNNFSVPQQLQTARTNLATGTGLRAVRSATGFAQAGSGIVDLVTPGKGNSRVSQKLDKFAKFTDETAKNEGVNTGYQGSALPLELAGFKGGGVAAKQVLKHAPQTVATAAKIYDKGLNKTANFIGKDAGVVGKTTAHAVRRGFTPDQVVTDAAMTEKMTGEDASKGRKITPQRVAGDAAMSIIGGTAAPLAGDVIGAGVKRLPNVVPHLPKPIRTPIEKLKSGELAMGAAIQPIPKGATPDPLESLRQEALKHKSADEFIKAQKSKVDTAYNKAVAEANSLQSQGKEIPNSLMARVEKLSQDQYVHSVQGRMPGEKNWDGKSFEETGGVLGQRHLTDLYNQAHNSAPAHTAGLPPELADKPPHIQEGYRLATQRSEDSVKQDVIARIKNDLMRPDAAKVIRAGSQGGTLGNFEGYYQNRHLSRARRKTQAR
jgi:hypothetical protein